MSKRGTGRLAVRWAIVFVAGLSSAAAWGQGACSAQVGRVVLNEYNHQDAFAEISIIDASASLAGWKVRIQTAAGAFSEQSLPVVGPESCGQYQIAAFNSSQTPKDADIVLLDASNNVVDILRVRTAALPVATSFYPKPACAYIGPTTDVAVDPARKGVDRSPDTFGRWRNTPGTGANSYQTPCAGNAPSTTTADTAITKTVSPSAVTAGQAITYTLVARNNGPSPAAEVVVRDLWPAALAYQSHTAPTRGVYDPVNRIWDIGALNSGGTATLTVTATAAAGGTITNTATIASDNVDSAPANNSASATVLVASSVDHYGISYPLGSSGLTCQPTTVRITAHDATHAAVVPPSGTTVTLATLPAGAGWALKTGGGTLLASPPRYVFSGAESFVELYLAQTTPASLNVNLLDGTGKREATGSPTEDAPAVFADTGLVFNVPDHAAGQLQSVVLAALRKDDSTAACVPAFAGVTRSVRFWSAYTNPATGTLPVAVQGTNVATSAPGTAFDLNFDASGRATVSVLYPDVGEMTLDTATTFIGADGVSRTLAGGDAFVVKPFGFKLAGLACATNFSPLAGALCPAGETVSGTLTAVRFDPGQPNALGAATPNFGRETPAQGVSPAVDSLVVPAAGGTATTLTGVTVGAFAGGTAAVSFAWPQVGSFRYRPAVSGGSYLGSGDLPAAGVTASRDFAGAIGRFYPYRFVVNDAGSAPGHPACSLTYAGQPFPLGFSLQAVAKDLATVTSNYGVAGYVPLLTAGALSIAAENADDGVDRGNQIVTSPGGVAAVLAPIWVAGVAAFPVANYAFRRGSSVPPYGPWDALSVGIRVVDDSGDQVPLVGDFNASTTGICASCDARRLTGSALRYGRLRMSNAFGSELTQLPVPSLAEFWTGSAWVQNTLDSCTALTTPLPAAAFSDYRRGLSAGETSGTLASPLVAGSARLLLSAPGAGNAGAVRVTVDAPVWLHYQWDGTDQGGDGELFDDDPSSLATFGVSRNNFIFLRENY